MGTSTRDGTTKTQKYRKLLLVSTKIRFYRVFYYFISFPGLCKPRSQHFYLLRHGINLICYPWLYNFAQPCVYMYWNSSVGTSAWEEQEQHKNAERFRRRCVFIVCFITSFYFISVQLIRHKRITEDLGNTLYSFGAQRWAKGLMLTIYCFIADFLIPVKTTGCCNNRSIILLFPGLRRARSQHFYLLRRNGQGCMKLPTCVLIYMGIFKAV